MPRQTFDIAYLVANHHLAFTKVKPLSQMEVKHVVELAIQHTYAVSEIPAVWKGKSIPKLFNMWVPIAEHIQLQI